MENFTKFIQIASQRQVTGKLLLKLGEQRTICFYFLHGRLFYATDDFHRLRRWYRAVQQFAPNFNFKTSSFEELWDYKLIQQGIKQQKLSLEQTQNILQTCILEVLFSVVSHSGKIASSWHTNEQPTESVALFETIPLYQKALENWGKWQLNNLGGLSPYLAPRIRQENNSSFSGSEVSQSFLQLLDGRHTIWDISYQLRQPTWAVASAIKSLVSQLEFKEIPDFPKSFIQKVDSSVNYKPLIACIDDSPVIASAMEKIVQSQGYRLLKIFHPLQEMTTLVQQKPDLIFLDVVMPEINGHSLCKFLRQSPVFQTTPIIILTSRDNLLNRSQAKFTGATDFLGKPPEPQKVLQMIQKHLRSPEQEPSMVARKTRPKSLSNHPILPDAKPDQSGGFLSSSGLLNPPINIYGTGV